MAGKLIKMNYKKGAIHSHEDYGTIVDYWQCETCKTEYPEILFYRWIDRESGIYCNGSKIEKCPYCLDK